MSLYDNVLFIFECFHDQQDSQWCEKASRKYPAQQEQNGQIVFLLSSDGLAPYCVNLLCWFTHETAAFYTEQCMTPSLFYNFEFSRGASSQSLKYYGFLLGRHFLYLYLRMCTLRSLSNDTKVLCKIADLEIKSVFNLICRVPGHGRDRRSRVEYALRCQSNQVLKKTEVGPYH